MWSYIYVMISKTREYIKCQTLKHLFWHVVAYYKDDKIFRTTGSNVVTGITNWCFTTEKLIFLLLVPVNQISNWQAWYIKSGMQYPLLWYSTHLLVTSFRWVIALYMIFACIENNNFIGESWLLVHVLGISEYIKLTKLTIGYKQYLPSY